MEQGGRQAVRAGRPGAFRFERPRPVDRIRVLRILGAIGLSAVLVPGSGGAQEPDPEPMRPVGGAGPVFIVPVSGVIELGLAPFIERSLREAEEAGASAVVLDIDTPGGRVDAAQQIVDALQDAGVTTWALVNRRAFSAGALIALATDGVRMRPGAVIGAATPVLGEGEKAPEKIVSAMRSEMRALAEARGLDPRVAEAMVDETIEVPGIVEAGKLLTLTTEEAVAVGYAEPVEDLDDLLASLGLQGARQVRMEVNWAERVVRFLTHPVVAPFLLSIGFLGLIAEIKTPGFGIPGITGLLALFLFFGSNLIVGLAGFGDVILFSVGALLLVAELLFVPGFGLLGGAGIVAMLVALFMGMIGELATVGDLARAGTVLSTSLLMMIVAAWVLLRNLPANQRLQRSGVLLMNTTPRLQGYSSAELRGDLVGRTGVALTDLRPSGVVRVGDERIDVVAESGWIEAGSPVVVAHSEGYRHVVREAGAVDTPPSPAEPGS